MKSNDVEKLIRMQLKFRAYVACAWAVLVVFALTGVILRKPAGVYVGIIISVMWVINRIIREAFDGLGLLRGLKEVGESETDCSDD